MKWQGRRRSSNVNDQRGSAGGMGRMGGRGMAATGGAGLIVALVLFLLTGDPGALGGLLGGDVQTPQQPSQQQEYQPSQREQQMFEFASVVLADIEDVWGALLPRYGQTYEQPTMTVYSGATNSACGPADAGVGPFYCPGDHAIYLDLSFYDTLVSRYGAGEGDFIMTYVIAHEAGHHVQTLLGVTQKLAQYRQQAATGRISQTDFNEISVRYELQADYLAGVVARGIADKGYMERGDMEEAMSAAAAVGDDAIQKKMQGYADPDTFNHGTSRQRQTWFRKGFDAGDLSAWDTFSGTI